MDETVVVANAGANVDRWERVARLQRSNWTVCGTCAGKLEANPFALTAVLSPHNGDPEGEAGRERWGAAADAGSAVRQCEACGAALPRAAGSDGAEAHAT